MTTDTIKKRYGLFTAIAMIIGIVIGSGIFFKSDNILIATGGNVVLGVIIFCLVWINIGWQGMLFLGAMTQISPEIFEAARLDGAGYWTRTFKIMLPLLVPTVEYSCITSVMWTFTGLYSLIFSITGGGPGYDTTTIDYMIYMKAFRGNSEFGYACALSVILMLIVGIVISIFIRVDNLLLRTCLKLLTFPVVVGVGYELIKLAGRRDNLFTRIISAPGKALQRITTREPDDGMIECAIEAMKKVIPEDGQSDNW